MINNLPLNWAIIGTGRIAETVAREIVKSGRHKIVSVYSRTQSKAERFAQKFGAKNYSDLTAALSDKLVDAVYIATPHSSHFQYIIRCVDLKVPILCEKAFTVNASQAEYALNYAEKKGVYLCEAMWTRFNPVVRQIVASVKNGDIGDIKSISANFSLPLNLAKPFVSPRVYKPEYAGGALLDLGVYPIAYAHMLLGIPTNIECRARIFEGVDYHDEIVFEYKNGALCLLNCSFDKLQSYTAVISGTNGKIISPMFYKPNGALIIINGKIKRFTCKRGYIYEFDKVADDIRNGKLQNEFMTHSDTCEIMKLLDECRKQNDFSYPPAIENFIK